MRLTIHISNLMHKCMPRNLVYPLETMKCERKYGKIQLKIFRSENEKRTEVKTEIVLLFEIRPSFIACFEFHLP